MPRQDIQFKTIDNVILRGWLYTPPGHDVSVKLPCLIMVHGWACVKEMELPKFAEALISALPIAVIIYDHRGFGTSDTRPDAPRREIVPYEQASDLTDAVTYASSLEVIHASRIGVWGYSFGGGAAITAAAVDPRIRAVVGLAPSVSGWRTTWRHMTMQTEKNGFSIFAADRQARMANPGAEPTRVPVVDADPSAPQSLVTRDAYTWFSKFIDNPSYPSFVNNITLRIHYINMYCEALGYIKYISPRAVLLIVPELDGQTPPDSQTEAFEKAMQPKRLEILRRAGHFDVFDGDSFDKQIKATVEFLQEWLVA